METVTIGIVAHVDRYEQASRLRENVSAHYIAYDSGSLGCRGNHVRVWSDLADSTTEWVLVLEDDAEPIYEFTEPQLQQALDNAPSPIVSLYLGTGHPRHRQGDIARALNRADKAQAHWISARHLLHAVAVAVRIELVKPMIHGIRGHPKAPIDEAITMWAISNRHTIAYTVPSLCNHADQPSLIAVHPDRRRHSQPRRAWRTGHHDHWNSKTVSLGY